MNDNAPSRLISFLGSTNTPCERLACTTCGGILYFVAKLRKAMPDQAELVECLKRLSGLDVVRLKDKWGSIHFVLGTLSDEERSALLEFWIAESSDDPDIALGVLAWTRYGRELPERLLRGLLAAAEPGLLRDRELRDKLVASHLTLNQTHVPDALVAALRRDRDDDDAALREAELRTQRHLDYLESLSKMPFADRAPLILADKSISREDWQRFGSAWKVCSDEEIGSLDAAAVQHLIDLCVAAGSSGWDLLLKRLYDRRHQLRLAAIDALRRDHGHLPPRGQLDVVVHDHTIPVAHYPPELAEHVTPEWLMTLPDHERTRFLAALDETRLRIWKKARDRCVLPQGGS
jgi:hypothetical protein